MTDKEVAASGQLAAASGGLTFGAVNPQSSTTSKSVQHPMGCISPPAQGARHLADVLADAGGAFCLIPRGGKAPFYAGWQKQPKTLEQARAHARHGGNVGLLGGLGGLVVLDFDQDVDDALRRLPQLAETIRLYRDNAPERGKFVVRVADGLPPNVKHHASGTEIISTGGQGVIHGTHPSGARVKWSGEHVAEVTLADLARLWHGRTGEPLGAHAAQAEAGPPDAEAVARSLALVDKVLELANVERAAWRGHDGGGRKAILKQCPFQPEDDPHESDAGAAVLVGADGRIGATCHHARCQERIAAAGGNGWALLKQIAGYRPAETPATAAEKAHARAAVEALREWVRRADFAEHVPIMLQACNGYRTGGTDRALADAILDEAHKFGRLTGLALPMRTLRAGAGLGSLDTVRKGMARLMGWWIVQDEAGGPHGGARYSIHPDVLAAVDYQVAQIVREYDLQGDIEAVQPTRTIYATSPLATHRAHDAFTASMTPITEEELQARIEARQMEIADADAAHVQPPPPIERRRYRRRLAAALPSAGRNVQLLVDALHTDGPTLARGALRELIHLSAAGVSRTIKRAAELGLVDADRHTVTIRSDWSSHLEEITPSMPTAGRARRLAIADADATLRYARHRLAAQDCSAEERERLQRRCTWATRRKAEIARLEGADRPPPAWAAPLVRPGEVGERMDRLRTMVLAGERAEAVKPMTAAQRMEFAIYAPQIEARWDEFNAWLTVDLQQPGWWVRRAPVDIVRHYKRFLAAEAAWTPPPVRLVGERMGVGHD